MSTLLVGSRPHPPFRTLQSILRRWPCTASTGYASRTFVSPTIMVTCPPLRGLWNVLCFCTCIRGHFRLCLQFYQQFPIFIVDLITLLLLFLNLSPVLWKVPNVCSAPHLLPGRLSPKTSFMHFLTLFPNQTHHLF